MFKNKVIKLFLVLGVILFIIVIGGCSSDNTSCVSSFIHIEYFYEIKNNILIDNKVTIGIGNSLFNENNEKIIPIDDDYYQGISNISILVFIDDLEEPKNKIEILNTDFFSNEYIAYIKKNKKISAADFKKTFVFDLGDYEINTVIGFEISHDWTYHEDFTNHSRKLFLNGSFFTEKFFVREKWAS